MPPLPLWSGDAPGALGKGEKDIPTLTFFPPDPSKATGSAILICPGGGYGSLADHEGTGYAEWLAQQGIAGLVLKYRLGSNGYRHPAMLQDATRAMRLARAKAGEWHLDSKRIGIMGSSAGGHLAATLLTHFDMGQPNASDPIERQSSRPDLGILCYPVISMQAMGHSGSRDQLLGPNPSPSLLDELSNEKQVKANTPPCFIWHTWEDAGVKLENSLAFAAALREEKIPFELHIYEKGAHGMGLGCGETADHHHLWTADLRSWLKGRGWL